MKLKTIFFLSFTALVFGFSVSAEHSFEIFGPGGNPAPEIDPSYATVPPSPFENMEIISIQGAGVADVSGIYSVNVIIKNSAGTTVEDRLMGKTEIDGNVVYMCGVDAGGYEDGRYTVYLLARDSFLQATNEILIGSFSVGTMSNIQCSTSSDKTLCASVSAEPFSGSCSLSNGNSLCVSIFTTSQ